MIDIIFSERAKCTFEMSGVLNKILCFPNDLSIGNILDDCISQQRINYIKDTFRLFPTQCTDYLDSINKMKESMNFLVEQCNLGESVRIWYSNQPKEYCGMCWILSELKQRMKKMPSVYTIQLPDFIESEENLISYRSWSEVNPNEIQKFITLEKVALPSFINSMIFTWEEMKNQNSELRVLINGTLQAVSSDFYDLFIKKELDKMDGEFNESSLIGNVLGKYQLGIEDVWIALRIEKMIEEGNIKVVKQSEDNLYKRILKVK